MALTQRGVGGGASSDLVVGSEGATTPLETLILRIFVAIDMPAAGHAPGARRQDAILAAIRGLRRAHAALHQALVSTPDLHITLVDLLVLHEVAHRDGATPGQVGDATGLTSGGVTNAIDRLEDKGLVVRRRSTADRRVVVVTLAPGAARRMGSIMHRAHGEAARLFAEWSVDRIQALAGMLEDVGEGGETGGVRDASGP